MSFRLPLCLFIVAYSVISLIRCPDQEIALCSLLFTRFPQGDTTHPYSLCDSAPNARRVSGSNPAAPNARPPKGKALSAALPLHYHCCQRA